MANAAGVGYGVVLCRLVFSSTYMHNLTFVQVEFHEPSMLPFDCFVDIVLKRNRVCLSLNDADDLAIVCVKLDVMSYVVR